MSRQRAVKLHDLAAHESAVNCLSLGPKSGRVLVTGGEDRRVNLWAIGKTAPVLSLGGHSTSIESVALDWPEELVAAGSASGAIKLWDLESAKVVRTLMGHKSSTRCLEFHPFGDFFASGSLDLSVKIWDVRRKGCIQTYQGHQEPIETLKITPDGRWIATGSLDHTIKIWDMTAGKLLHSIESHSGPISSLAFHPSEFLMASSSKDGFVKVFDLQTFECVSNSYPISPVSSIVQFSEEGHELYTASQNAFKAFTWEPFQQVDEIPVSWPHVTDFKMLSNEKKIVGATKDHNLVGIWILDVSTKPQKLGEPPKESEPYSPDAQHSFSGNFNKITLNDENKEESQIAPQLNVQSSMEISRHQSRPPTATSIQEHNGGHRSRTASQRRSHPYIPVSDGNKPLNLDISKFIGSNTESKSLPLSPSEAGMSVHSDSDLIESLLFRHTSLCSIFQSRLSSIRCVREVWDETNIRSAVEVMSRTRDSALWIDILRILNLRPRLLTLDVAVLLLPLLKDLLFEFFEDYILTACDTIKLLSKSFSGLIVSSLTNSDYSGVDISREERIQKCKICHTQFMEIVSCLQELQRAPGKIGSAVNETLRELDMFAGS